jgi:hypothetical protein
MGNNIQHLTLREENGHIKMDKNFISAMARVSMSTAPLIERISESDIYLKNIEDLEKYLWELYEKERHEIILAIVKSLYIINGLHVPGCLNKILCACEKDLYSCNAYEILVDLNENIVDCENEI